MRILYTLVVFFKVVYESTLIGGFHNSEIKVILMIYNMLPYSLCNSDIDWRTQQYLQLFSFRWSLNKSKFIWHHTCSWWL